MQHLMACADTLVSVYRGHDNETISFSGPLHRGRLGDFLDEAFTGMSAAERLKLMQQIGETGVALLGASGAEDACTVRLWRRELAATTVETPWGMADGCREYGEGIAFFWSPMHGGFRVPANLLHRIPADQLNATHHKLGIGLRGMGGWFEEHCDWSIVALAFPQLFTRRELEAAQQAFNHWITPKLVNASARRSVLPVDLVQPSAVMRG